MRSLRFRRQFSIGPYVVDFFCPEVKIAVELDGSSHFSEEAQRRDRIREEYLRSLGVDVIRVLNASVSNGIAAELIGSLIDAILESRVHR